MMENGMIYLGGDYSDNNPYIKPLLVGTRDWIHSNVVPNVDAASVNYSADCSGLAIVPDRILATEGVDVVVHPEGRRCASEWGAAGKITLASAEVFNNSIDRTTQRSLAVYLGAVASAEKNGRLLTTVVFKESATGAGNDETQEIVEVKRNRLIYMNDINQLVGVLDCIRQIASGELKLEDGYQKLFVDQPRIVPRLLFKSK